MPNLLDKVRAFFQSLIPVQRRTVWDPRTTPLSIASVLDVDSILSIFSEAETGDVTRLFALYRDIIVADNHTQTEFAKRLLAVLGDVLSVQPADEHAPEDKAAAEAVRQMVNVPGWTAACAHLLTSTLWPVAVVEKVYAVEGNAYRLAALVPVPFELLNFTTGRLKIRQTDPATGAPTSTLCDPDPARYIVHRGHLLPTPDFWGGPFRSLVFWWFLGAMDRDSWGRFLERYGAPFLVGKYDQADDASRSVLTNAFSAASRLFGIVISKETDVEIKQASAADAGEAFELFHATANKEKSKLILGQTMSAEAQSTGIGQGASPQHETVRQDIRQFDAQTLATTLKDQLVSQFLRINGLTGKVKLTFGGESSEVAASTGLLLVSIANAGLQVADSALPLISQKLGFQIERAAGGGMAGGNMPGLAATLLALAADPLRAGTLDRMSGNAAAELARKFRESAAPLRRLIADSRSPEEVLRHVQALSIGLDAGARSALLTEALTTYAVNGAVHIEA